MQAATPKNEQERLADLLSFDVLDTEPEEAFDRLTHAASLIFDAPIGLISLVDQHRQFFKSHQGLSITETPREHSFCAHTILQDTPLVVTDATADPRFADSPLVTGQMEDGNSVLFYVGAPLITKNGNNLGALCVIDTKARPAPTQHQIKTLQDLSAQVVELLEARKTRRQVLSLQSELDAMRHHLFAKEERMRQTTQTAALALEAGNMGFWDWSIARKQVSWSAKLMEIFDIPFSHRLPSLRIALRSIHELDRRSTLEAWRNSVNTRSPFLLRCRVVPKQAAQRSITCSGTPYFDDDGSLLGALGVVWDSTERDRHESTLARTADLFQGLNAACPVGIFVMDAMGTVLHINERAWAMVGITDSSKWSATAWRDAIHPDDVQEVVRRWRAMIAGGDSFHYEFRVIFPNGDVRWILGRGALIRGANGPMVGAVGTVDDITERRQTLLQLHTAKNLAEEASRSKDMFLANMSHELRTPLNGVLGMLDLLSETTELSAEQREMADMAQDCGRSLLMLVNDILDLTRIEAGKVAINNAPFQSSTILQNAIAVVHPPAMAKGLSLELVPAHPLPMLLGDAGRIQQIILVFLTNAVKFTEKGSVRLNLISNAVGDTEYELLFTVHDTGPGIDPSQKDRLFRSFSQGDESSTRQHGGVGLGLAIAKRVAELMGGSVGVMSEIGAGATFWLRLRLPIASPTVTENAPKKYDAVSRGRALAVEDNPTNHAVLSRTLRHLGWECDLASDGRQALAKFQHEEYKLVLMDCQMPEMDGYETTRKLRALEKEMCRNPVPIIAVTANAMAGDRQRCIEAGMDDYLAKPFGLDELRSTLDRWQQQTAVKSVT